MTKQNDGSSFDDRLEARCNDIVEQFELAIGNDALRGCQRFHAF